MISNKFDKLMKSKFKYVIKKNKPCEFFFDDQLPSCSYGDKCEFSHTREILDY